MLRLIALMMDPDPMRRPNICECAETVKLFLAEEEKLFYQQLKLSPSKKNNLADIERVDDLFTDHGAVKFEKGQSWDAQSNILSRLLGSQRTVNSVHVKSPVNSNSSKMAKFAATASSTRLSSPSQTKKPQLKLITQLSGKRTLEASTQANQINLEIATKTPQSFRFKIDAERGFATTFSQQAAIFTSPESPDQNCVSSKCTAEGKSTRRGLRVPSGFMQPYPNKDQTNPPQTDLEDDEVGTHLGENSWISSKARLMNNSQGSLARFKLKPLCSNRYRIGNPSALGGPSNGHFVMGSKLQLSAYPSPVGLATCDEDPMPEEC